KVMPKTPSTFAIQTLSLIPDLDTHFRQPSLRLPLGQVPADEILYHGFAPKVSGRNRPKFVFIARSSLLRAHPLDAVQSLLKDIVGAWFKVFLLPQSKTVSVRSVLFAVVTAQCGNFGSVLNAIDTMDQVRFLSSSV